MSVQIISDNQITAICQFAEFIGLTFYHDGTMHKINNSDDAKKIGLALKNANISAYNARYGEDMPPADSFKYHKSTKTYCSGIQLYILCDSMECNSDNFNSWGNSLEGAFLSAVRNKAIRNTEEYRNSKWII